MIHALMIVGYVLFGWVMFALALVGLTSLPEITRWADRCPERMTAAAQRIREKKDDTAARATLRLGNYPRRGGASNA